MLKRGLPGRGSNLLKSGRPLTPSTPGWRIPERIELNFEARVKPYTALTTPDPNALGCEWSLQNLTKTDYGALGVIAPGLEASKRPPRQKRNSSAGSHAGAKCGRLPRARRFRFRRPTPSHRASHALLLTRQRTNALSAANKLLIRCAWAGTSAFASAGYGSSWGPGNCA